MGHGSAGGDAGAAARGVSAEARPTHPRHACSRCRAGHANAQNQAFQRCLCVFVIFVISSKNRESAWTDCALFSSAATPAVEVPSISSAFPKVPLKIVLPRQPTEELIMEAPTPSVPKKKKKEKALTRAERGGMSASDLVACRSVVRKIVSPNRTSPVLQYTS